MYLPCFNFDSPLKSDVLNMQIEGIRLQVSGYNEADRFRILKGGFRTFEKLKEKEKKGERPFFRPASFEKIKRKKDKLYKNPV